MSLQQKYECIRQMTNVLDIVGAHLKFVNNVQSWYTHNSLKTSLQGYGTG